MRIGFIEDTPLHGGTQIWVTEAVRIFLKKGEDVVVLAPTDTWVANECIKAGATVKTYDWDKVTTQSQDFKKIWIEALSLCDVAVCTVHPPRNNFHCSVFAGKCIKEGKLDTVLIPKTGTIVPEYLREFYLPEPDINSRIICITNFTKTYLIEHYKIPADIIELIYQGTEVDRFTSTPETRKEAWKRYPLTQDAFPVIGCVGSFENRKGQIILLEAAEKLLRQGYDKLHIMFVGDGPDEEMLKNKIVDVNLQNNVSIFPFTREPNYVFERIDILALPSLYKEGLPNVLLEAMSMRVPVIASNIAGIPEIVFNDETGYLIEPGNVEMLAEAIIRLQSDREKCKRMGENARKLMEEKFDKKVQFDVFLNYFYRITKK